MSLRERIDSELKKLADYPESLAERDARYDARDAILKAIEAESQAIRADERERLAKVAIADDVYLTTGERADAWIRGQGEEQ